MFSQGDKGTSWYIIWKGSVNVVTHGKVGVPSLPALDYNRSLVHVLIMVLLMDPRLSVSWVFSCLVGLPPWVCPGEGWGAELGSDGGLAAGAGDHTARGR